MEDGVLYRCVTEGGQSFHGIYIPKTLPSLIQSILKAAHNDSGHNGFPRTYSAIRRLYYWKGIKEDVGGSMKILTDNGTEFKNEVFKEMLQSLGTKKFIHSPPYRPQSNGRIEGFHRYLKACIAKHMQAGLEWDEITAMATVAYNHFPNMSAKESAFFLMYGRDPVNKLSMILNATRRYLGDVTGFPDLEALKNMYQMVAQQLMSSRERYVKSNRYNKIPDHGILVGDLVLVKDHTAKSFAPKYKEDFWVVQIYVTNALHLCDKCTSSF